MWSLILEKLNAMNSACHFFSHLLFGFSTWRNETMKNSLGWQFLKIPHCRILFFENHDDHCFLWDLGLWILTIWPSHSYTLVYCRPIHLNSIELQSTNNDPYIPPKRLILPLQLLYPYSPCGHFDWNFFYKLWGW
jgi:hypothetical protein